MRNVTVDSRLLEYHPPLCGTEGRRPVNSGAVSHSHCSPEDFEHSVSFTFTGVAVYYLASTSQSPTLSARLTVDGETSEDKLLAESVQPSVLWAKVGLDNAEHKVVLATGATPHHRLDFGSFLYTVDECSSQINGNEQELLAARSIPLEVRNTQVAAKPSKLPMILGSVFGGLVFFIFLGIAIMLHRQRKSGEAQYAWKRTPIPPLSRTPDPGFTLDHATSFSNHSPVERKVTMDYESHHLPNLHFAPSSSHSQLPRSGDHHSPERGSSNSHHTAAVPRVPVAARVHERYQAAMSSPESAPRPLPQRRSRNNSVQSRSTEATNLRSHPGLASHSTLPQIPPSRESSPPHSPYSSNSPERKHSYIPNSKLEPLRRKAVGAP
ncbi:hypothetical protein BKA70DRAFT_1259682 [Coprinopsis sp. MPI-PUGE-AT-0042]|nr:hypothetical protein BKA70DRAFT_1259682 [Coprinopsis sp. MPI-PUGE-AT-0042]